MLQTEKNNKVYSDAFYVFSVEKKQQTKVKAKEKTESFKEILKSQNIPFKTVEGCFNGIKETSFIVPERYIAGSSLLNDIFTVYNQDSVLRVLSNGSAYLETKDDAERLGKFIKVPLLTAKRFNNYTVDGNKGYVIDSER